MRTTIKANQTQIKELGERLRALRTRKGVSQKDVGLLFGVSDSLITKIEGGQAGLSQVVYLAISSEVNNQEQFLRKLDEIVQNKSSERKSSVREAIETVHKAKELLKENERLRKELEELKQGQNEIEIALLDILAGRRAITDDLVKALGIEI